MQAPWQLPLNVLLLLILMDSFIALNPSHFIAIAGFKKSLFLILPRPRYIWLLILWSLFILFSIIGIHGTLLGPVDSHTTFVISQRKPPSTLMKLFQGI